MTRMCGFCSNSLDHDLLMYKYRFVHGSALCQVDSDEEICVFSNFVLIINGRNVDE